MIPVRVSPLFFLTAALIGFLWSNTLMGTLIWMMIIFVSVLVHEYGHALTAKAFGQSPRIELVAFGGLTIPQGKRLSLGKEFLVVLMGPAFGFLLFLTAYLIEPYTESFMQMILRFTWIVNLFWTAINLLPILPLDGGQLVRIVCEALFGARGMRYALYTSIALSVSMCVGAFLVGYFLMGAFFLLFAFQSFEGLRTTSLSDRNEGYQNRLFEAERMIGLGHYEEAKERLKGLIEQAKSGLIHTVASEYLAKIYYDQGEFDAACATLSPVEKRLSREGRLILYFSAYEMKDFSRVIALAGACFQEKQTADVALRAAAAHAMLHEVERSIEWLKTVRSFGEAPLEEITKDHAFDAVREDKQFQVFLRGE